MPVSRGQFTFLETMQLWGGNLLGKGEARIILGIDREDENEPAEENK